MALGPGWWQWQWTGHRDSGSLLKVEPADLGQRRDVGGSNRREFAAPGTWKDAGLLAEVGQCTLGLGVRIRCGALTPEMSAVAQTPARGCAACSGVRAAGQPAVLTPVLRIACTARGAVGVPAHPLRGTPAAAPCLRGRQEADLHPSYLHLPPGLEHCAVRPDPLWLPSRAVTSAGRSACMSACPPRPLPLPCPYPHPGKGACFPTHWLAGILVPCLSWGALVREGGRAVRLSYGPGA